MFFSGNETHSIFLLNFAANSYFFFLFHLVCTTNAEKAYFDQHLECSAPKHWSKYTTVFFKFSQNQSPKMYKKLRFYDKNLLQKHTSSLFWVVLKIKEQVKILYNSSQIWVNWGHKSDWQILSWLFETQF